MEHYAIKNQTCMSISQLCLLAVTRLLCIQIWAISARSLGWFYFVSPTKAVGSTTSQVFGVSHCLSKSWFSLTLASLWLCMSFSSGHVFPIFLVICPFLRTYVCWYTWLYALSYRRIVVPQNFPSHISQDMSRIIFKWLKMAQELDS